MSIEVNFQFKTIAGESIIGEGDIPIPSSEIKIDVTPIVDGHNKRLLFNENGKISEAVDLHYDSSRNRLGIGYGGIGSLGAQLDIKSQGVLSTDRVFRSLNANSYVTDMQILGNGDIEYQNNSLLGSKVVIKKYTSYDAGIDLIASGGWYSRIWNDMSSGNVYNTGVNIFNRGQVGGSTAKINNVVGAGLQAYGEGYGFNWAFTSNSQGNFTASERAMWLTHHKSLALFNGTPPSVYIPGDRKDCFEMYSADRGGLDGQACPHFRCENGDTISLFKQDFSTVTTLEELIAKLSNLGIC